MTLLARPAYRNIRVKWSERSAVEERFIQGDGTYAQVLQQAILAPLTTLLAIPDVGPHVWKYSESDRSLLRYWFGKLQREANAFAHSVVRQAASFPQLLIANPILRANYARMVEHEVMRVIDGKSRPEPTIDDHPMELDVTDHLSGGVPELVAAELVRDVFEPDHFTEFCHKNHVTIKSQGKKYRISRKTHALIEVWDEQGKPEARLCVVFRDPGMPPSDEVVMKYLLVKHQPEELWRVANQFPPGSRLFED